MGKYMLVDSRMRNIEKEYIKNLGYALVELPKSKDVYPEISSHVDIFCAKINDILFLEPNIYKYIKNKGINIQQLISCNTILKNKYPYDIAYNVCQIGNNVIHNFKYTDEKILEYIDSVKLNKIHINQGYSKCSIAVISSNSAIVTDKNIANELEKNNINVLYLEYETNIKLFSEDNGYSNMAGFIGGSICNIDNRIVVFGDLDNFKESEKIRNFIHKQNLEIDEFKKLDIIDYGSVVDIIF